MSQRTKPVILLTDLNDVAITEVDLGTVTMNGDTYEFRVWNNLQGFKAIPSAVAVKLILESSPKPGHELIKNDDLAFRGRCTYSAKQGGVYNENFSTFPLENTDYDTIGSEEYNQYEISLEGSGLSEQHKSVLNGSEQKIYIVVEHNRGVVG